MIAFKYIVQCYKCNCSSIEENRENSLFSERKKLLCRKYLIIWTTFQNCYVHLKSSFDKKIQGHLLVSNVFLDRKHSTKSVVCQCHCCTMKWL